MAPDESISIDQLPSQNNLELESIDRLYSVFLMAVALTCIAGTIKYWALLMGITDNGVLRFDIAPLHWRLAGPALAILLPLTALGIWFRTSFGWWGWLLITFMQYMMHAVLPDWFGVNALHLMLSGSIVILFALFQIMFYLREKNRAES